MKKIVFVLCMLAWSNIYPQLFGQQIFEEKNPSSFSVELDGLIIIVPSGPIERQCQFVAYRSVNDPYSCQFDQKFFSKALTVLKSYHDPIVLSLENWGNILSLDTLIIKEKFDCFLRISSENYNISTQMLSSNDIMEVWQIGKVKLFVYKESIKRKKNKILIPEGYYYITTKQLLN